MEQYTRRVDELGRVVLPIELRRALDVSEKSQVVIGFDPSQNQIVIQKGTAVCIHCGAEEDLKEYQGKHICTACLKDLAEL